jgi:hypothetical protein
MTEKQARDALHGKIIAESMMGAGAFIEESLHSQAMTNAQAQAFRPLSSRMWDRLGFGWRQRELTDWRNEDAPGLPNRFHTDTIIVADWKDRLRFLISGKAVVAVCAKVEHHVGHYEVRTQFSVLKPSFPTQAADTVAMRRAWEEGYAGRKTPLLLP